MADISVLARLVNGAMRNVDLTTNTPVVLSVKVGGSASNTELTKAILDSLISNSHAPGSDNQDIVAGSGLTGGGASATVNLAVDSTVIRTSGANAFAADQSMGNHKLTNLAAPTADADASTKKYVDDTVAAAAPVGYVKADGTVPFTADQSMGSNKLTNVANGTASGDAVNKGQLDGKISSSEKGAANGVATLGADSKIPASQIPAMAITETFVVVNEAAMLALTAQTGDIAIRSDESKTYILQGTDPSVLGDWVYLQTPASPVLSVNGQTGTVSLDTDDVSEGATNLYFTEARAKSAAVADSITDGVTDVAPSQNAVFDALALKADSNHTHVAADITDFDSAAKSAAVENAINSGTIDKAPSEDAVFQALAGKSDVGHTHVISTVSESLVAGESFSAGVLKAVRFAKASDSGYVAGRVYNADNDASTEDKFYVIGLVRPGILTNAGGNMTVIKSGMLNTIAAHGFTPGEAIYLTTSGDLSNTAPTDANTAIVRVGIARTSTLIEVQIQVVGVN